MTVTSDRESRRVVSNSGFANPITLDQYVENSTHVKVYRETDGTVVQLSVGTHYTLAGVGTDTLDVTITATGLALNPDQWIVFHDPPLEQGANLSLGGRFGLAYEQAMDALVRRMQSITDKFNRSVALSLASPEDQEPILFPPADPGKAIVWSADGLSLENSTEDPDEGAVVAQDAADDAAASATAAAASQAAAAASASAAATSQAAAANSATNASNSSISSAASATTSTTQATNSANSATAAAGSATTATTQATDAAASALAAAGSAGAADASADFAIQAGLDAEAARDAAVVSQNAAAVSATDAAASAVAAASSASGLRGMLHGYTMTNGVDTVNDVTVAPGACRDVDDTEQMVRATQLIKQLDAAWAVGSAAGGRDAGAIADGTWHVFVIKRTDTNVVDILFSLSATAPTMPANYTKKRRIGSVIRSGGTILQFKQDGDRFRFVSPNIDVNVTNPGTSAATRTLTVPTGIVVHADIVAHGLNVTSGTYHVLVTAIDETDTVPSVAIKSFVAGTIANAGMEGQAHMLVKTNTSGQVRSRQSVSGASDTFRITTFGYVDSRGRLA